MAWKFLPFIRNRKDVVEDQEQENKKDLNRMLSDEIIKCSILKWYLQNDRSQVERTVILQEMFGPRINDLMKYLSRYRDTF